MKDFLNQMIVYARGIWRQRWYFLLVAWLVCIAGWAAVYQLPDKFQATARVHVDTQSVLKPLLRGLTIEQDTRQQILLMTRTLLSRPNLEKIARMTDLDLQAKESGDLEKLLSTMAKEIKIEDAGRENLFMISYAHNDPKVAKRVVQALLTVFVENTLGESRQDTDVAQRFLDEQIKGYEEKLIAAEEQLKEFKRKNVGVMPGEGKDYFDNMQQASAVLEQARIDLREAEQRRNELRRQLEDEEPTIGVLLPPVPVLTAPPPPPEDSKAVIALQQKIDDLQSRLDLLLLQFTERHPDVAGLKRKIADLEEQKRKEQENAAKKIVPPPPIPVASPPPRNANPIYAQTKIVLNEAEAQVASLQARVREHERRVVQLRGMVNTVPEVEADLARLNRDYAINKKNYEELLARRESAQISEKEGQSADDIKFKIVDPPFVPSDPAGPNRPLLFSIVFAGGILLGLLVAFVLSEVKPVFDTRRSLADFTGLPVLGSVSMVWTAAQTRRRRLGYAVFIPVGISLLGSYATLMVLLLDADLLADAKNMLGM